jgi:ligand-binding sensor domain-containing protein
MRQDSFQLLPICFFLFPAWMAALDPHTRISQYGHSSWKIQDGYFGGEPVAVTQTTDGYLWVGTENGVYRFDGVQFVPWTSLSGERLPSNIVMDLFGAKDGSLWIATDEGLLQWQNGRSARYLNGRTVGSILQDENGKIWVSSYQSSDYIHPVCGLNGTDFRCYSYESAETAHLGYPLHIAQDRAGNFWVGHDTAVVQWRPGHTKVYRPAALQSQEETNSVGGFAMAADGSMLVGFNLSGRGTGLQHVVDGVMTPFVVPKLNGETLEVDCLLFDHQGNLWVGTANQGIYRIHGTDVDHYGSRDGLSGDMVLAFSEDREGNLWIATAKGFDMLRNLRVTTFSSSEGLNEDTASLVLAGRDGTVWFGTNRLQALVDGRISTEPGKELPGNEVTSLFEDHSGRLWVGMDNALWVHEGGKTNGKFRQIFRRDGEPMGLVWDVTEDSEHNIWVSANGHPSSLIRIQDLEVREELPKPLNSSLPYRLAPDPQNGIWIGTEGGSLARFRSGKGEIFNFGSHPNSPVKSLLTAPDGSILGATNFGVLGWKNGKQQILSSRNGLPCDDINMLNLDDQGDLWLYAACGLIEIKKDDCVKLIDVKQLANRIWALFLPSLQCLHRFHPWVLIPDEKRTDTMSQSL